MTSSSPDPTPQTLTAVELAGRLARGEHVQLVDVREAQELALARLPHPVNHLPLSRASEWMGEVALRLDRHQPVVVLCHAGVRSWRFGCWLLASQGFSDVWNLEGGIDAWSVCVDPTVPRY
ncbi:MAG: rhodanese-like domain-containing protein [Cyanobacteriota bacterium]|nr:rhodanese-like domain-containing protein [Cyanobacteriota bacterium]